MSDSPENQPQRPLSPHLQVYKPQLTSVLSILNRASGVALTIGMLLIACWLTAAARGEESYNAVHAFIGSPLGTFMVFGWSVALFYHLSNGVRHLIWDMGYLLKIKEAYKTGYLVLLSTAILTASAWACSFIALEKNAAPPPAAVTEQLTEPFLNIETKEDNAP